MTPFRYLCIYCVICAIAARLAAHETCTLPNGEQGYCRDIRKCESAKAELKLRRKPSLCGFDKNTPIVCCSDISQTQIAVNDITRNRTESEEDDSNDNDVQTTSTRSIDKLDNFSIFKFPISEETKSDLEITKKDVLRIHDSPMKFTNIREFYTRAPTRISFGYGFKPFSQELYDRNGDDSNHKRVHFETQSSTGAVFNEKFYYNSISQSNSKRNSIRFEGPVTNVLKPPRKKPFRFLYYSLESTTMPNQISDDDLSTTKPALMDQNKEAEPETTSTNATNVELDRNETSTIIPKNSTANLEITKDQSNSTSTINTFVKAEQECKKIIEYGSHYVPRTRYITNGQNADYYEFPHMAALGYGTGKNVAWKCGGTLISDRFVVTAAHCVESQSRPVKFVRLGDIDTLDDTNDNDTQILEVSEIFVHPLYKQPSHYHDIALLQLSRSVNYSMSIMPACLQSGYDFGNTTLWATGWGSLHYAGDSSSILQKVDLRLFSTKECYGKTYGRQRRLTNGLVDEMQICAGNPEQGKDTCQGDSGGPLQVKMFDYLNIYRIVGVTSFGIKCGVVEGIYTRVSYYIQWIEGIVWPT